MPDASGLRDSMRTTGGLWAPERFTIHPEGHPEEPRFTKHAEVANGDIVFLRLAGVGVKGAEVRADHVERLLVGNGWETFDAGKSISHPTDTAFPGFMGFGRWIDWAVRCDELVEDAAARGVTSATEARFWAGVSLSLEVVTETYTLKKDGKKGKAGETVSSSFIVPSAFLGAGTVTPTAATAAPPVANGSALSREALIDLARTHSQHSAFLADALAKYPELRDASQAVLFTDVVNPDGIFRAAR